MARIFAPLIFLTILLSACTSHTHIQASDPETKIYVNGEYMGTGDAHYHDRKISFASNEVKLQKEGCQADYHTFSRNEGIHLGAVIAGYFWTWPYLWFADYKHHHGYDYQCESGNSNNTEEISESDKS